MKYLEELLYDCRARYRYNEENGCLGGCPACSLARIAYTEARYLKGFYENYRKEGQHPSQCDFCLVHPKRKGYSETYNVDDRVSCTTMGAVQ